MEIADRNKLTKIIIGSILFIVLLFMMVRVANDQGKKAEYNYKCVVYKPFPRFKKTYYAQHIRVEDSWITLTDDTASYRINIVNMDTICTYLPKPIEKVSE